MNDALERSGHVVHGLLHLDVNDGALHWPPSPGFSVLNTTPAQLVHEDYAPYSLLGVLLLFSLAGMAWPRTSAREQSSRRPLWVYGGGLVLVFLFFSAVLRWQIWHDRLLLPFFVLASPLVAVWISQRNRVLRSILGAVLFLSVTPALLRNQSRPLFGEKSIFSVSSMEQYFANQPDAYAGYAEAAAAIEQVGVGQTGFYQSGDTWEYPLWVMLHPQEPLRFWQPPVSDQAEAPLPALVLSWKSEWNTRDSIHLDAGLYVRRSIETRPGVPALYDLVGR